MIKTVFITLFFAWQAHHLIGNEAQNLPVGSILPDFRDVAPDASIHNPFLHKENLDEIIPRGVDARSLENYIIHNGLGFLHAAEFGKSSILLKGHKPIAEGQKFKLHEHFPGAELELQSVTASSFILLSNHQIFEVPLRSLIKSHGSSLEIPVAQGVLIHKEGWVVAPIGDLRENDELEAIVGGVSFPASIMQLHPAESIAILKLIEHPAQNSFPFIPIAKQLPSLGDTLYSQRYLLDHKPLSLQLVTKSLESCSLQPALEQEQGALTFNQSGEIVAIMSQFKVFQNKLQELLATAGCKPDSSSERSVDAIPLVTLFKRS